MVRRELSLSGTTEIGGSSVCIQTDTITELNLADDFHAGGMKYESMTIETNDEVDRIRPKCATLRRMWNAMHRARCNLGIHLDRMPGKRFRTLLRASPRRHRGGAIARTDMST